MGLRVDFTNVGSGFEPIPDGEYEATVYSCEVKTGQTSGQPYLNWQFKLQGGEFDGRRVFYTTSLQPQSLWNLKKLLIALGYNAEDLKGSFDLEPIMSEVPGMECVVVIGHEEYNGETRDRVLDVKAAGSSSPGDVALFR